MTKLSERKFKVTINHTGSAGGTTFVLNHGFGHTDIELGVWYDSGGSTNRAWLPDVLVVGGSNFGYDLVNLTTESCELRIYQWANGSATANHDAEVIVRESQ